MKNFFARLGKQYCFNQAIPLEGADTGGGGGGYTPPPSGTTTTTTTSTSSGGTGATQTQQQAQTVAQAGGGGLGTADIPILRPAAGVVWAQGPSVPVGPREIVEVWPAVTGANLAYVGIGTPSAATGGPRFRVAAGTPARTISVSNLSQVFVTADVAGEGVFISKRPR